MSLNVGDVVVIPAQNGGMNHAYKIHSVQPASLVGLAHPLCKGVVRRAVVLNAVRPEREIECPRCKGKVEE